MNVEEGEPVVADEERLQDLTDAGAIRAASRSAGYRLLAAAFEYPEGALLDAIRSGELGERLAEAVAAFDPGLSERVDREALADAGEGDDLAVEYTRLFDVGVSGPPCPLYGGLYGGARMKTMEEAVRFYNHFGLSLSETQRELPDHLSTQLEFLHYLAFREAQALQEGTDAGAYRRAQRDFLERHPGRWVPKLRERVDRAEPMRFFGELVRTLERFLQEAGKDLESAP